MQPLKTLLDLHAVMARWGGREALRSDDGFRTRTLDYRRLREAGRAAAAELRAAGVEPGDRVMLWGENRLEWASAFWGCLLSGAVAVPVDFRSSPTLARSIAAETRPRLALTGEEVDAEALSDVERFRLVRLGQGDPPAGFEPHPCGPNDVVEIVYTSGSTSRPKGVVHRHRNICSNLNPIAAEIEKYRRWAAPFQPIRLLDLLPLSHMFGQTMGLYIPVLLGGSAVFAADMNPKALIDLIRRNRVSAATAVPAMLASLKTEIERRLDEPPRPPKSRGWRVVPETWRRHRRVHRRTGWKFWAFVVGGARLDENIEQFWNNLGYGVVQGYGLTEASPVVALNHPFSSRRGSIGRAVAGQEVRLAPDGEILVRGEGVVLDYAGDAGEPEEGSTFVRDGWLHTGDLGAIDEQGRLYFRGRKRDLIVRADGLNVHPRDVEHVLDSEPGVRESAVVGVGEKVHAALVLDPGADAEQVVARANRRLESHQRIQEHSEWAAEELPRTPSTLKIRRSELARLVVERQAGDGATRQPADPMAALLGRPEAGGDAGLRLDADLGLTSLERVDLMTRVERNLGTEIDEDRFAEIATVGELRSLMTNAAEADRRAQHALPRWMTEPRWTRRTPVRWARRALQETLFFPLSNRLMKVSVEGLEHLGDPSQPVIFAANHQSHLDTLAVLRALPRAWRGRIAPAMSQDFFAAFFKLRPSRPRDRLREGLGFFAALALFNAYPLPRKMSGTRRALRYTGELIDAGWSPLVFPEGTRSPHGAVLPFQPGIGLMAKRLNLRVVPIRLSGLIEIYSARDYLPQRSGTARVVFGPALDPSAARSVEEAAALVERAVRELDQRPI